ncbi:protein pygopus-like [Cylas formicarius]|uniref:protein pygopus-like n=1 Tax=Cylas formicarius TaxID=197179 RepID=UPI0029586BDD|nr:protein pygopus-like [Cylas formicarius]
MCTKRFRARAVLAVIFVVILSHAECGRTRGGSRPSSSWGSSSHSRPSTSWSSHNRPSPSSYGHPASLSYPSSHYNHPAPSHPASPPRQPATSSTNTRPIGWNVGTHPVGPPPKIEKPVGLASSAPNYGFKPAGSQTSGAGSHAQSINVKPVASAPHDTSGGSNPPSYGFKPAVTGNGDHNVGFKAGNPGHDNPHGTAAKPSAPVGPPANVKPVGNALPPGAPYAVHPPPYNPHGQPPPAYNPNHDPAGYGSPAAYNPAGYGPPPAYNPAAYGPPPAYSPAGYGHSPAYGSYGHPNYPQAGGYHPNAGYAQPGGGGVTIINNNNNNNYHGGGLGGGYGGGFGYPSYHYSSSDVGSGALGFFLGYSLAKVTTPTFHYSSGGYDGYLPRYDHYTVHHYYHNRDSIPAQSTIQPNAIVGCVGNSGSICPPGTTSLCTNNGAILCVASATTTVPCSGQNNQNCIETNIPCINGTGNCETGKNQTVTIPCVSNAKVLGNITYVNNTIIVNNTTIINNNVTYNGTIQSSNSTLSSSTNSTEGVTFSPLPVNGNNMSDTVQVKTKREANLPVHDFCVTVLALPAERKPSEAEMVVSKGTNIFTKFLVKALGIE